MEFDGVFRINPLSLKKVDQIAGYMYRNTKAVITSMLPYQVSFKIQQPQIVNSNFHNYKYISITMSTFIYQIIPIFFKLGKLDIDLEDYDSVLDTYLEEVNQRLSTEEESESVHLSINKVYEEMGI